MNAPREISPGVFDVPGLEVIHQDDWPIWPTPEQLRLFKAAPALLAALQDMLNERQPLGIHRPTYQAGLAAVELTEAP